MQGVLVELIAGNFVRLAIVMRAPQLALLRTRVAPTMGDAAAPNSKLRSILRTTRERPVYKRV